MDIEIIPTPDKPYINDERLTSRYNELVEVFKWGDDKNAQKKIKQCIDNHLTDAYQNGQMNTRAELNITIAKQRQRIKELDEKYEPKAKSTERYKERSDRFVND
jgi:hypothetical protein